MFTGIIEEKGQILSIDLHNKCGEITIGSALVTSDLRDGDSIAVNGVCLTAIDASPSSFKADVSPETLDRTTLGALERGSPVNLERAVTPSTRLGGHMVQGHVDDRGTFLSAVREGDFWTVKIGFAPWMSKYFIYKGSVAIEGISLTIAALGENDLDIAVIPKTWEVTNLSSLKPGDPVNIEVDVIAKYVERMMESKKAA